MRTISNMAYFFQQLRSSGVCTRPHVLWARRQDNAGPDRGASARDAELRGLAPAPRGAHGRLLRRRGLPQADGTDARASRVGCAQVFG